MQIAVLLVAVRTTLKPNHLLQVSTDINQFQVNLLRLLQEKTVIGVLLRVAEEQIIKLSYLKFKCEELLIHQSDDLIYLQFGKGWSLSHQL